MHQSYAHSNAHLILFDCDFTMHFDLFGQIWVEKKLAREPEKKWSQRQKWKKSLAINEMRGAKNETKIWHQATSAFVA